MRVRIAEILRELLCCKGPGHANRATSEQTPISIRDQISDPRAPKFAGISPTQGPAGTVAV